MNKQYYYLTASLPYLIYGRSPHTSVEDFLLLCQSHLSKTDFRILKKITASDIVEKVPLTSIFNKRTNKLISKWIQWEKGLRNGLVKLRSEKSGLSGDEFIRKETSLHPVTPEPGLIKSIFEAESPLTARNIMDKARWNHIEKLEYGHYFGIEKIILYALKLQILNKQPGLDPLKGRKKLEAALAEFKTDDVDDLPVHDVRTDY